MNLNRHSMAYHHKILSEILENMHFPQMALFQGGIENFTLKA